MVRYEKSELCEFLKGEDVEKYFYTDLTYSYFLKEILELQAIRRDNIPQETLRMWFREFIRLGWTSHKFKDSVEAVKRTKIYGAIDFTSFLESEKLLNNFEVEWSIKDRIKEEFEKLSKEAEQKILLLSKDNLNIDDKAIQYAVKKEMLWKLERDRRELFGRKMEEQRELWKQEIKKRKLYLKGLPQEERKRLIREYVNIDKLTPFEIKTMAIHIEYWLDKFPESYFEKINEH